MSDIPDALFSPCDLSYVRHVKRSLAISAQIARGFPACPLSLVCPLVGEGGGRAKPASNIIFLHSAEEYVYLQNITL